MKTVILCGGLGTRIRDVADNVPKPMISVGQLPILWHLMKYYANYGHHEFVLCLGYKGKMIKDFFLNYEAYTKDCTIQLGRLPSIEFHDAQDEVDWKITLAETGLDTMTGGRIHRIKQYVQQDEHFFMTYGDGLSNIDLDRLLAFHLEHGRILTVTGVRPPGRFGELVSGEDGVIAEFNEKPQVSGALISGGFFVCHRDIFNYLDETESLVFEQGPMKSLVKDKQLVMYEHEGFWQCMDTHRDWQFLNSLFDKREAPWMIW